MTRSYFDFKPCGPSNRQVFTDYSTLYAHLTAQGPTYKKAIPLYPIGTTSSEENIIGHWGYNSSGAIAPMGEVRFTKVTPSQYGVVSALDGGFPTTICTLAGHNITATSGIATVWDTTGAVELSAAGGVSWTRVGDVFTFAVAQAGLAVGDQVFVRGISEFSIGGATRDIRIYSGSVYISTGITSVNGISLIYIGTIGSSLYDWSAILDIGYTRSVEADGQRILAGVYQTNLLHCAIGVERVAGADWTKGSQGTLAALTATNNEATVGAGYPITQVQFGYSMAGGSHWTEGRAVQTVRKVFSTFTVAQPQALVLIAKPAAAETCTMSLLNATVC